MKSPHKGALVGITAVALASTMGAGSAQATGTAPPIADGASKAQRHDNLPNPLAEAQARVQKEAVDRLLSGKAKLETRGGERVIALSASAAGKAGARTAAAAKTRYVRYPVERKESILSFLVDFGDQVDPALGGGLGPMHNQIPEPDRVMDGGATDDNSTYWIPDFNKAHFMNMMFGLNQESFKTFYRKQSNGRFQASGDVSDWVKVPYNEARYGSNAQSDSAGYWPFIEDTATAWWDAQKAAGKSDAQIATYLKAFDKVDRYDADGDGIYLESDGYIDHFQAIHAGEGEEAGGGEQGDDAIWSHRWYVNSDGVGSTGPAGNLLGGTQIGNSGIWIGDYTTEPENGGVGVFTHEFGHDLGLADYYDTSGGGENSTGFWTLMSAGSWMNHGGDSIGTTPGYMGPHEKLLLGWLDYQVVRYGTDTDLKIGPADRDDVALPQALAVTLPPKTVDTTYNDPHSGTMEWWGGSADGLQNTLTRSVDLSSASSASLSAWIWADIEADYDYLYAEVSTDGGTSWTSVGDALSGEYTSWTQYSYDLSAYAGQSVLLRFRYATDGGVHYAGPFIDDVDLTVDGASVFADDVEGGDNGWTAAGFTRMSGSTSVTASRYYLAENRVYNGYDATLKEGPYNFGWGTTQPNRVEHFPYQNGLLVWYVDNSYEDNNTSQHPGGGWALPVDARPAPIVFPGGAMIAPRRAAFDATFGPEWTNPITLHRNGVAVTVPASKPIATFVDTNPDRYYSSAQPFASVKVGGTGTSIRVAWTSHDRDRMNLQVRFAK